MLEEPFASGNSLIHRFDPRTRVVFAGLLSIVIATCSSFPALVIALGVALLLVILAGLKAGKVVRRLMWVNTFVLFLWIVLPFSYDGHAFFEIGPFAATVPGVVISAQITLKSNAIILTLIALLATMTTATMGHALSALYVPDKIVHLLLMTYRYIFVLEQESQRLIRAAKIRGFKSSTSLHAYKTYAYLVGMLFVKASERAQRVYQAMQCRGFNGRFYCLKEFATTRTDYILSILLTGLTITIIGVNYLL